MNIKIMLIYIMIWIYLTHVERDYLCRKIFGKMFRDVSLHYIMLICNNLSTRCRSV